MGITCTCCKPTFPVINVKTGSVSVPKIPACACCLPTIPEGKRFKVPRPEFSLFNCKTWCCCQKKVTEADLEVEEEFLPPQPP